MTILPVTRSGVYPSTGHKWKLFHLILSGSKEELAQHLNTFQHPIGIIVESDLPRGELVLHCNSKHQMKKLKKDIEKTLTTV